MSSATSKMVENIPITRGFEGIRRHWSRAHNLVIAKILPGEMYVSISEQEAIATTLGSCISACIWDDVLGIGGMNHFLLPGTQETDEAALNGFCSEAGRYGVYAMETLINGILTNGGQRHRLKVKLFGAGNVLKQKMDIGERNIQFVHEYLSKEQLTLDAQDLGGNHPRKVIFHPKTGRAWIKKMASVHDTDVVLAEQKYQRSLHLNQQGSSELF